MQRLLQRHPRRDEGDGRVLPRERCSVDPGEHAGSVHPRGDADQPECAGAGISRARRRSRQRKGEAARVCRAVHHREQPALRYEYAQRAPASQARRCVLEGVLGPGYAMRRERGRHPHPGHSDGGNLPRPGHPRRRIAGRAVCGLRLHDAQGEVLPGVPPRAGGAGTDGGRHSHRGLRFPHQRIRSHDGHQRSG